MPTSLEPPDSHHLQAALGWLELGNTQEAAVELARLSPTVREHPEVLEARWRWCAAAHRWEEALAMARAQVAAAPHDASGWIHQAYALHELRRTAEARELLQSKVAEFPKLSLIPYNLACYACQLGALDEARRWLGRALQLCSKDEIQRLALNDPDLKPLWDEIRVW